jgi:hypothetical protein
MFPLDRRRPVAAALRAAPARLLPLLLTTMAPPEAPTSRLQLPTAAAILTAHLLLLLLLTTVVPEALISRLRLPTVVTGVSTSSRG